MLSLFSSEVILPVELLVISFQKGDKSCDFLDAFLCSELLGINVYYQRKEFAPQEKDRSLLIREIMKKNLTELILCKYIYSP